MRIPFALIRPLFALAAITPMLAPSAGQAASSGSGHDNARDIGTLTIEGQIAGQFKVKSYGWAQAIATDPASGQVTGAPLWTDLQVTKAVDALSPLLTQLAARGTTLSRAILVVHKPGTTEQLVKYTFSNIRIVGHSSADQGRSNGFPIEDVTVGWQRITVQFGTGSSICWDRFQRRDC